MWTQYDIWWLHNWYHSRRIWKKGFSHGDAINITFNNNISFQNIPYFTNYIGYNKQLVIVSRTNYLHVAQKNSSDDFWKIFHFADDTTATISIAEKGKFKKLNDLLSLEYTDNRDDYGSDEQYANFRCVTGGQLKDNFLYRGCTPSSPIVGDRYTYVQELMEKQNIGFSINLSNTKEEIDELSQEPSVKWSEYLRELYNNEKFYVFHFSVISDAQECCEDVVNLFKVIINKNPQDSVYVHCDEGKDRTGAICMLIESLCGCSYNTILNDYMLSYKNFYKLDDVKDKECLEAITKYFFNELVYTFISAKDSAAKRQDSYKDADFSQIATDYLKIGKMDDNQINQLKTIFCKG